YFGLPPSLLWGEGGAQHMKIVCTAASGLPLSQGGALRVTASSAHHRVVTVTRHAGLPRPPDPPARSPSGPWMAPPVCGESVAERCLRVQRALPPRSCRSNSAHKEKPRQGGAEVFMKDVERDVDDRRV